MSQIAFSKIPTFQNMMNVSTILGLDSKLNRDSLYDELVLVETKSVFESIIAQPTCLSLKMAAVLHSAQGQCGDGCRPSSECLSNCFGSVVHSRKQRFLLKCFFSNEYKVEGGEE